jgi:hypothetical protein
MTIQTEVIDTRAVEALRSRFRGRCCDPERRVTVATWTAFVLTIPFTVFILPYFLGVALLQRGSQRWTLRNSTATTRVTT